MKSFQLKNIKSFKDTGEIELKPITLFVGKNSSGKSSLVRFPVVLAQTFLEDTISPIVFNGKYLDYGNFEDVVFGHEGDEMRFRVEFQIKDSELQKDVSLVHPVIKSYLETFPTVLKKAKLEITISKKGFGTNLKAYHLFINNIIIFKCVLLNGMAQFTLYDFFDGKEISPISEDKPIFITLQKNNFLSETGFPMPFIFPTSNFSDELESIVKLYIDSKFPDIEITEQELQVLTRTSALNGGLYNMWHKGGLVSNHLLKVKEYLDQIGFTFLIANFLVRKTTINFHKLSNSIHYIGPFRDNPQRNYRSSEAIYNYVGKSGQNTSNLLKQAHQNQHPLFEKVSAWFTKTMGYNIGIEEINGANLFKIKVYSENDKRGKDLIDVGFGISQILPIITQLYYDKSKDDYTHREDNFEFFVIEQPEIHLHPNAQAELANLFVDKIQSTDKDVTLLIETHSEHLVRRLQSLVADPDNEFNREDVVIYYVDMDKEGVSTVKKMEMNESGQFEERWPSGFFDKAYELSKELMRNASKRAAL